MIRSLLMLFIGVICIVTVSGQDGKYDRQVFYKHSLIAIVDPPAKMGIILDYSSRLIVALNGKRSSIIVVDVSERVRYHVEDEADTEKSIWSNFDTYFEKQKSLKPLLKLGKKKGEKSKLSDLGKPKVLKDLKEVLNSLGGSSEIMEERSILTKFLEQLRGRLSLMYVGSGSFRIFVAVLEFAKVNLAVADLLNYSEEELSSKNVHLNATKIFKAQSGAEVMLNVLSKIGERFDLIKLFDKLFISPKKVQSLLVNASSGSHDGLDGLVTILANYVNVYNEKGSIIRLITSVLAYNSRPGPSLSTFINQMMTEMENQDKHFHNGGGFLTYVDILEGILTYDYTEYNISLSDIITLLPTEAKKSSSPLIVLVKQLSSLYPASTVPHFFKSALERFNRTLGNEITPETSEAEIFYIHSFIAIINKYDKMAIVFDYASRLIVVLNSKRSSIIVIDFSNQERYYLENEADTENQFWSNFRGYLQKQSFLKSFLELGEQKGVKSKIASYRLQDLMALMEVFKSLGGSLPIMDQLSLHRQFIEQLGRSLNIVYKGQGGFRIASGVDAFLKVNLAVAAMLTGAKE